MRIPRVGAPVLPIVLSGALAFALAACGGSSGGGAASGSAANPASSAASSSAQTDTAAGSAAWPPSDACALLTVAQVEKATAEKVTDSPRAIKGVYGPQCEYDVNVASPIVVVQAWPVEDLAAYTKSLTDRGETLTVVTGVGTQAQLEVTSPTVADVTLYVVAGTKAFSVQVAVYGGAGTWTTARATASATDIAKDIAG